MKNYAIFLLAGLLTFGSCTTASEWNRGVTGAYVGSMFGSLIGDIVGGYHGSTVGALIGGAAGAAAGVASAQADQQRYESASNGSDYGYSNDNYGYNKPHKKKHNNRYDGYNYDNDIYYGNGGDYSYVAPSAPADYLDISNIVFADQNNNRWLEGGETAYITFDIHNSSPHAIYNVAPIITCDNHRIRISPTATIAKIEGGRGMRYKAVVCAQTNVKSGPATFYISFAQKGGRPDPEKSFRINVRR